MSINSHNEFSSLKRLWVKIVMVAFLSLSIFVFANFQKLRVQSESSRISPEPDPRYKVINYLEAENADGWLPTPMSDVILEEVEEFDSFNLRLIHYESENQIVTTALDFQLKQDNVWRRLDILWRAQWSDYMIDTAYEPQFVNFKYTIALGKEEVFFANVYKGFNFTTLDGGKTWHLWTPSEEWQPNLGDPELKEYEMSQEGEGKLVYYNWETKKYTYVTSDKGFTWTLLEITESSSLE